jgi:hypothetical protein
MEHLNRKYISPLQGEIFLLPLPNQKGLDKKRGKAPKEKTG